MPGRRAIAAVLATAAAGGLIAALVAGSGDRGHAPATVTPYSAYGLTVGLPAGWRAAPRSLTPHLADPRERLSVATFALRYRQTLCAHMPGSALDDLGARDAFVTLQERGTSPTTLFPPRPADFAAGEAASGPSEAGDCAPGARFTDHWFTFADGGRNFHVLVAFGPDASAATRRQAWHILDGLRVDPGVRPTWPDSG
jgi:hypothetical protein